MRVLHVLDHSLPHHSGYAFRTVAILREQRRQGWDTVHVTTPRHGAATAQEELVDGWRFHRTPLDPAILPIPWANYLREMQATARRLEQLVREHRPDVLHAHSPVLNALPAIRVGRRYRLPVVYEVRALWEDAAVDHGTTLAGSLRYRISRWLESHALHRVDHITTICEGLRGEIASRGIPLDRITVIPNAVDADAFSSGQTADLELKQRLGLEGATVLGFIGSFYDYEGLDLLIKALPRLLQTRSNTRILLVGGGPEEAALKSLTANLGLAERVIFAGRIPHAQVQGYYDLIDVLVYPRRRMRLTDLVTPLKPLEAMAQERLLVASDVGDHKELIQDGKTGVLFPADNVEALAEALNRLLSNPQDWVRLRAEARRFVEAERTWATSVARYAQVYRGPARRTHRAPSLHAPYPKE